MRSIYLVELRTYYQDYVEPLAAFTDEARARDFASKKAESLGLTEYHFEANQWDSPGTDTHLTLDHIYLHEDYDIE